jgi:hypothetical protein
MQTACMEEGYEVICRGIVDFGFEILAKVIMKENSDFSFILVWFSRCSDIKNGAIGKIWEHFCHFLCTWQKVMVVFKI